MCCACDGQLANFADTGSPSLYQAVPLWCSAFAQGLLLRTRVEHFYGPLRFSDLIPSNVVAGSVIATIQSANG